MMKRLFEVACSRRIVKNALTIALAVGMALNIINQGEAIVAGASISWLHLALNYLVPYSVASYSAAKKQLAKADE